MGQGPQSVCTPSAACSEDIHTRTRSPTGSGPSCCQGQGDTGGGRGGEAAYDDWRPEGAVDRATIGLDDNDHAPGAYSARVGGQQNFAEAVEDCLKRGDASTVGGLAAMRAIEAHHSQAPHQEKMADEKVSNTSYESGRKRDPNTGPPPAADENGIIWGRRLHEQEVLHEAWWLLYCCFCCGLGHSEEWRPCQFECSVCCCTNHCKSEVFEKTNEGGVCSCIHNCCCWSEFCAVPQGEFWPRCVVCTHPVQCCRYTGDGIRTSSREEWRELEEKFDQCVLCFTWCAGCVIAPRAATCFGLFAKCCCCTWKSRVRAACPEGPGAILWNGWCILAQCRCPPDYRTSPVCACCGCRLKSVAATRRNQALEGMPAPALPSITCSVPVD